MTAPAIDEIVRTWHWLHHVRAIGKAHLIAEAEADLNAMCERFRMAQRAARLFTTTGKDQGNG